MELKIITFLATIIFSKSCFAAVISQNALASVLQDILSPASNNKAMQMINVAAIRSNKDTAIPNIARAECGLPARMISNGELPIGTVIARSDILPRKAIANELPRAVIISDGLSRMMPGDSRTFQSVYPEQQIMRPVVKELSVPRQTVQANLIDSLLLPKEIYQTTPIMVPQESVYTYSTPASGSYPFGSVTSAPSSYLPANPYLPIASPISAMSTVMPPPTQSRGQFLRKIPIPPPTL